MACLPHQVRSLRFAARHESLRTCHLRGWLEIIHGAVPQARYEAGGRLSPAVQRAAPLYRLTDTGWHQLRRTHAWVVTTCLFAAVTLAVAIVTMLLQPGVLQQVLSALR